MLTAADAQAIVDEIMQRLGRNVNIMDEHGTIIASGDRDRVGAVHDGARRVLAAGEPLAVTGAQARRMRGTRAGVNLPIRIGEELAGVVGVTGEPREIGDLAAAVVLMTELLIAQRALRGEAEWRQRTREQIVADLAAGGLTAREWRQRLRLAGVRLAAPYRVYALRPGRDAARAAPREMYRMLAVDEERVLAAVDATGTLWAVAGATAPDTLRPRLAVVRHALPGTSLLDAGEAADFAALAETVRRARLALRRTDLPAEGRLRDLELPVLLAHLGEDARTALAERVLGPLPAELRRTLDAYFDHDRHAAGAAAELNVHRNTLVYRLGRIAELTGYDPRRFDDAVTLRVALHLIRLD
ncbi:CdaR family transcriptional regulator [Spirillospora sp. NPDC050679]